MDRKKIFYLSQRVKQWVIIWRKISIIPICISIERRINTHMYAPKAVYRGNLTFRSTRSKSHDTCPDIQEQIVSL